MIKKTKSNKRTINLDGPDGNAFVLLAICKDLAKQIGLSWDDIQKEAKAGDYCILVYTLNKYFGDFIDFETEQEDLLNITNSTVKIEDKIIEQKIATAYQEMGY